MSRFEDIDGFESKNNDEKLGAGDFDIWSKPPKTTPRSDTTLAYVGDTAPTQPPTGGDRPTVPTDKPPTPPPTGEVELPKVTEEEVKKYLKDNPDVARNIDNIVAYLKPERIDTEYEKTTKYNDLSSGQGSTMRKEMMKAAIAGGPKELALFMAAINEKLKPHNMSIEASYKDTKSLNGTEQKTGSFVLKRPETDARKEDKFEVVCPATNVPTTPRGQRGLPRQPG